MVNEKDANNEQNIRPKNPAMSEKEAVSTLAKS